MSLRSLLELVSQVPLAERHHTSHRDITSVQPMMTLQVNN